MFDETLKGGSLHYGFALIFTGFFLLLTIWKKGQNDVKYLNHEELREKHIKNMESNPMMNIKNSSLFFIPFGIWQYILWASGAV